MCQLIGELTLGQALGKLATCIVDDLEFDNLGDLSQGLLDVTRAQAPRLQPEILREALNEKRNRNCEVEELPAELRGEWEKVRNLIGSINRVRVKPRRMRHADIVRIVPTLRETPIGPPLKVVDIPEGILQALADHIYSPEHIRELLNQGGRLAVAATEDPSIAPRLAIRPAALPPVGTLSADDFWTRAFAYAGMVSRRTVAALLSAPAATWALEKGGATELAAHFIADLNAKRIP